MRESAVENELCRRVAARGGLCLKVQTIGRRGFFDRIVVLPGRVIFVELKRPRGGRLSAHQKGYAESFAALGASVALVQSFTDIDRLIGS
jgi:hypothetical protein